MTIYNLFTGEVVKDFPNPAWRLVKIKEAVMMVMGKDASFAIKNIDGVLFMEIDDSGIDDVKKSELVEGVRRATD